MKKSWVAGTLLLASQAWSQAPEWVAATVVKTDAARGKVTLKHEKIASIGMEAMTMPFKVKEPSQLAPLKAGDKVRFTVADDGGELLVTHIRAAR